MHQPVNEQAGIDVKTSVEFGFKAPISSRNKNLIQEVESKLGVKKSNTNIFRYDDEFDSCVNLNMDTMGGDTSRAHDTSKINGNDDHSIYELDSNILKMDDTSIYAKRNPKLVKDSSFNTYRKPNVNANKYFKPNDDES